MCLMYRKVDREANVKLVAAMMKRPKKKLKKSVPSIVVDVCCNFFATLLNVSAQTIATTTQIMAETAENPTTRESKRTLGASALLSWPSCTVRKLFCST